MKSLSILILCCALVPIQAQNKLTKGAEVLFASVITTLTNAEKNEIFKLAEFALADNGKQFYFISNESSAEFPFNASIFPLDLNEDGEEELALIYGNMMTSGNAGSSAMLFIKNNDYDFESHLGFPGTLVFIPNDYADYPDVIIAGPGFEFPVWSWDGTTYAMDRKIKNDEMASFNPVYLAQASKAYTESLKKERKY